MNKQQSSSTAKRAAQAVSTDFDDWETDPDFIRDIDEIEQRWGSRRTVGSIDMNDLKDRVNKEHEEMRERFKHPSQKIDYDHKLIRDTSNPVQGYEERMSKHSSTQEISRKVYTSTSGSESGFKDPSYYSSNNRVESSSPAPGKPNIAAKPQFQSYYKQTSPPKGSLFASSEPRRFDQFHEERAPSASSRRTDSPSSPFKETISTTKRVFKEQKSSASSSKDNIDSMPSAFKSIQDKIDAFKKEFEDIENRVSRKSDISKVITKSSKIESLKPSQTEFVYRDQVPSDSNRESKPTTKTTSPIFAKATSYSQDRCPPHRSNITAASGEKHLPKGDIRNLSKRFESLGRESEDDFKRRTDARRKEFFDQIKEQVRETRKNLEGFDTYDDNNELIRPKTYVRSETTKEEFMSKIVKENDKIVENETKRNVERSSSRHGSSDDNDDDKQTEPTSIKYLNQQMRNSPVEQFKTRSPVEDIKRKVPVVATEVKGAGLMARTLYDYLAGADDELSFEVDDLITNIDKVSKEWYSGTITKNGKRIVGMFPANYVKLLNDFSEY